MRIRTISLVRAYDALPDEAKFYIGLVVFLPCAIFVVVSAVVLSFAFWDLVFKVFHRLLG